ncbi:Peptidylprolyl isomerase [Mycena kentingensis (nom. inval.)]|nr:Peptidylprolyl isomerase [Mycena kentingensis (nom. inval.)]
MAEIAVGVWSSQLKPKQKLTLHPPASIRLVNIALGDVIADQSSRTTIKLTHDKIVVPNSDDEDEDIPEPSQQSTVLCALTPGKIEQVTLNLILEGKEDYILEAVGANTVYLTGNYIDVQGSDMPPFEDDSDLDEEDEFDLREVSSDVEMNADELDDEARFEEIDDAVHGKDLKRPRESDATEKGTAKKQKNEDGEAVKPETKKEKKDKKKKEGAKEGKEAKPAEKPESKKGAERELAGGLRIREGKVGTGPMAKKGHTVSMRYIGKLQNGKVFDSNTKGKPFTFHLGKGEVIKGWDEGIVGMQVGGERVLTIPAPLAYGKRSQEGIPANSTLIFDVKLTDLK